MLTHHWKQPALCMSPLKLLGDASLRISVHHIFGNRGKCFCLLFWWRGNNNQITHVPNKFYEKASNGTRRHAQTFLLQVKNLIWFPLSPYIPHSKAPLLYSAVHSSLSMLNDLHFVSKKQITYHSIMSTIKELNVKRT